MYDCIIIGGGPAGAAAAVYAARKKIKALLIAESIGGQSVVSESIENWIGEKSISGFDLGKKLEEHVRAQEDIDLKIPERANAVKEIEGGFSVECASGAEYQAKTVLLVTGGRRRKLNVPGEDAFLGKGVAYCATCDAPLFRGKQVAVVGGGNSALEAVIDLLKYATHVYLLVRGNAMRADAVTQQEVNDSPNTTVLLNTNVTEIIGEKFVKGLVCKNSATGEEKKLDVGGVFIEIGSIPNADMAQGLVDMNAGGEIVVDHRTGATSKKGIWAAGDVTDGLYKQNNIAAGDAVKAMLSIYAYLSKNNH